MNPVYLTSMQEGTEHSSSAGSACFSSCLLIKAAILFTNEIPHS